MFSQFQSKEVKANKFFDTSHVTLRYQLSKNVFRMKDIQKVKINNKST